ncbi:hypothetical protein HUJ04_012198 [Dendroctonus ponderosae]|nr:hypothetical protein HUJ04_012198 [Dendroctonus ponderosae]
MESEDTFAVLEQCSKWKQKTDATACPKIIKVIQGDKAADLWDRLLLLKEETIDDEWVALHHIERSRTERLKKQVEAIFHEGHTKVAIYTNSFVCIGGKMTGLQALEQGTLSCNAAAIEYKIPEATLRRYRRKQLAGEKLPQHAVRKLAFQFGEKNGIQHRLNRETKIAGIDWFDGFKATNHLSLRNPEATSVARLRVQFGLNDSSVQFNQVSVEKMFTILRVVKEKCNFSADRIYNADESGLSTVPTKLPKMLTPKGQRLVSKIVSAERGRTTTLVCAINAVGFYVPPFFVFARQRMKLELLNGCPPGSHATAQSSG